MPADRDRAAEPVIGLPGFGGVFTGSIFNQQEFQ